MRRMGETATPHGFRSAFSDWSNETTAYTMLTIEAALAHATGSKTEKAYRRGDQFEKRRKLMEAWSTHVTTSPAAAAEIGATVPRSARRDDAASAGRRSTAAAGATSGTA
jgi:predicted alternative tryptophan synthase beta-subunit